MDKRYQVFVSSTYKDLKNTRENIIRTLIQMNCFPAGMELFPARDEEQFNFIKKVISDCDYYVLVIGGRYGSISDDGKSYTEKEYDYAVENGMQILAFLHSKPDDICDEKDELLPEVRKKFNQFRHKVQQGRLVKEWSDNTTLISSIIISLQETFAAYPAEGWVRASGVDNSELLKQINGLHLENTELKKIVNSQYSIDTEMLSQGKDTFLFKMKYNKDYGGISSIQDWSGNLTWDQIFHYIAPDLFEFKNEQTIRYDLGKSVLNYCSNTKGYSPEIDDEVFKEIKVQFISLGYIELKGLSTVKGGVGLFWRLTEKGKAHLLKTKSIQRG